MTIPATLPGVEADPLSAPFFAASAEGRLVVQRCAQCGVHQLGSLVCNGCGGSELPWVAATGRATIHAWTTMHMAYGSGFEVPYTAAVIELEEGPRIYAAVSPSEPLSVGQPVVIEFAAADGGQKIPIARPL